MSVAPYSYPNCVIHYPQWYKSKYLYKINDFEITKAEEILPLIEVLIENKVTIKLNMISHYEKE
jgi:hypothetical protein